MWGVPHKAMLHLAAPVQDLNGMARCILVLNVAAQSLLDSFTDSLVGARDHAMLLNSGGYWLASPNREDAWGFMFQPIEVSLASFDEDGRTFVQATVVDISA